jgi:hypothetical protein
MTHSIEVSEEVYRRLQEQAARLQLTPEQMADRLLTRELADLTMENGDQELSVPAPGSAEALAAVRRLTTLFAGVSIPDLEQALADPMIALANADVTERL